MCQQADFDLTAVNNYSFLCKLTPTQNYNYFENCFLKFKKCFRKFNSEK